MKKFLKKLKKVDGQSLAEFAVTTAMMATLATTAAPKFSGVGEGAKEKKTMADMDKIMKSANNFYNEQVTSAGRGRFPGQEKYNEPCPTNGG
jgi:Tfp pilus assembly protein PilE